MKAVLNNSCCQGNIKQSNISLPTPLPPGCFGTRGGLDLAENFIRYLFKSILIKVYCPPGQGPNAPCIAWGTFLPDKICAKKSSEL